eukprot:scaffold22777_cov86-Skeletonema_dohrnii-CCMP3373.AAC.1
MRSQGWLVQKDSRLYNEDYHLTVMTLQLHQENGLGADEYPPLLRASLFYVSVNNRLRLLDLRTKAKLLPL